MHHMCDNNGYITGIRSEHDNGKEDRRSAVFSVVTIFI